MPPPLPSLPDPPAGPGPVLRRTLRKFARYRDIVLYRTVAGIKSEARQNYLGYLWFLLEPVLSTAVLYLAFTKISGLRGPDYIAFLLTGLIAWQWFESSIMVASGSLREKYATLLQFNLPKFIFPAVAVLINTWKFAVSYLVILVALPLLGFFPGVNYLALPLLMLLQLALILGVAVAVALLVALSNDLRLVTGTVLRLQFFMSGIFFDSSKVPDALRAAFYANPMAVLIESYRDVVLHNRPPDAAHLLMVVGLTALWLAIAAVLHHRLDKRIVKLIHV